MAKEATNPKSSIQTEWYCLAVHKITWDIPWSARELRNCPLKKSDFVVSYKLLTSIAYKLKQLLSYFTLWTLIVLGSPFVCKLAVLWCNVILSNKVEGSEVCLLRMRSSHAMHFTTLCLWWLHSRCLPNPFQSDIWWITTASRNSYNLYLFVSTITVTSWRRSFLSSQHVSSEHYRQAEVFCSW